jgi:S1-C subfamily serine protease
VAKGFLGVGVSEVGMSGFLAQQGQGDVLGAVARLYRGEGAVVTRISPGSPAERAGLRIGDVIMSVGGRRIATREQVLSQVGTSRPGSLVALDVWRPVPGEERGERLQITAELATLDPTVNAEPLMDLLRRAGLERLSDARGPVRGVLVGTVRDGSSLVERLPAGSVITAVDGQSVASLDDLMVRFIRNASTRVRLQGPTTVRFTVRLPNGAVRDVDVDLDSARETR